MSNYVKLLQEFAAAEPFKALLDSSLHPVMGFIFLAVGLLSVLVLIMNSPSAENPSSKSAAKILQLVFLSVIGSISLAFGTTFVSSAVGVYT